MTPVSFQITQSDCASDLKMDPKKICPYGLKTIVECITRATLLSQPTDIPGFLNDYLFELIDFRRSYPEADFKDVSFHYQEQWGELHFKYIKPHQQKSEGTTDAIKKMPETYRLVLPQIPEKSRAANMTTKPKTMIPIT